MSEALYAIVDQKVPAAFDALRKLALELIESAPEEERGATAMSIIAATTLLAQTMCKDNEQLKAYAQRWKE